MSLEEINALKSALIRERESRKIAEKVLEEKVSVLNEANANLEQQIQDRTKELERIARFPGESPSPLVRMNRGGAIEYINRSAAELIKSFEDHEVSVKDIFKSWLKEAFLEKVNLSKMLQCDETEYNVIIVPIAEYDYANFYFSNVTGERKATRKLEESEQRYRKIVEESVDIILKIDIDGDLIYINPAAEKFFGYTKKDLLGTNYSNLLAGDCKSTFFNSFGKISRKEVEPISNMVCSVQTRKKGVRWLSKNLQKSTEIMSSSFTIIARDVTQQKIIEDKLLRSEEKYKRIIENMKLGLLEVDNDNKIIRVYDHFCKLTGYSEEELVGKKAMDVLTDEESRKKVQEHREKRFSGEETVYEALLKKKDGTEAWVLISGAPLYDDFGNITGSIGIHLDVTNQKNVERELIKARFKAEESSRSKEQFLANMSHEIRTPMNAIIGMTDLLLDTSLNSEQQKMLKTVQISSKNLLVVINDILDFSKIESGKLSIEKIGFKLRDVINHIVRTKKIKAESKDIWFEFKIADDVRNILVGDPFRLTQILLNLLSNANKFTEKGGVKFTVSSLGIHDNIQQIQFKVEDTGRGISPEKLETIFDVFSQEDETISRKYGGTGLGLSITKKLVELHDGTISVDSTVGVGTTFTAQIGYVIGNEEHIHDVKPSNIDYGSLNDLRILLAEDNEFNQVLIQTLFHQHSIELEIANNGAEVLEKLSKSDFDIILMDIQMPVMDGIEATKQIRKETKWDDLPILALTANAFKKELEKYKGYGMDDSLSKPFQPDELYSKIIALVNKNEDRKQPKMPTEVKLYDLKKINILFGGNIELVKKLVDSFVEHTPGVLDELSIAANEHDWKKVSALSHRLKASLNTMSINSLSEDILALEVDYQSLPEIEKKKKVSRVVTITYKALGLMAEEDFQNLE